MNFDVFLVTGLSIISYYSVKVSVNLKYILTTGPMQNANKLLLYYTTDVIPVNSDSVMTSLVIPSSSIFKGEIVF